MGVILEVLPENFEEDFVVVLGLDDGGGGVELFGAESFFFFNLKDLNILRRIKSKLVNAGFG